MTALSLHHLTILAANPLELVSAAAAGEFEYCGLRLVAPLPTDPVVDVIHNQALIRDVERRLRSTGVRVLDIEAIWLEPSTDVTDLEPALAVGQRLGARQVLTVGFDDDEGRLLDNFCRLCDTAGRHRLDVTLEFITYCPIGTLAQARSLIARSGQPNAKLLIDALQFFRSGATPDDLDSVDPSLLPSMQLSDGPRLAPPSADERKIEARTARLLPGEGQLPIASLVEALPADIPISVEAPTLRLAGWPFDDQARIVGDATRRFLATLRRCSSTSLDRRSP